MKHTLILSFLGHALAFLAFLMTLPLITALLFDDYSDAVFFFIGLGFSVFIAGLMIFAGRKAGGQISRADLCLFAFISWAVIGAAAALPLLFILDLSVAKAYFLAQSAFTTTGASLFSDPASLGYGVRLWLALLQWFGGLASILGAILVLAPLGVGGMSLRQVAGTNDETNPRQSLASALKIVMPFYCGFTLLCLLLLLPQASFFDALCLAFSTISTGGMFLAESGDLLLSPYIKLVLGLFMLIGAMNIVQHYFVYHRHTTLHGRQERKVFLILIGVVSFVLMILLFEEGRGGGEANIATAFAGGWGAFLLDQRWLEALGNGLFAAISVISTTSFHPPDLQLPFIFTLLLTFLGGMTLSTAGGIKIMRVLLLLTQGRKELTVLAYPHDVKSVSFEGNPVNIDLMQNVWIFFALFNASLAALLLVFSFTGLSFEHSLAAAVAAISNAGPMLDIVGINSIELYSNLPQTATWFMTLGMIAGRIEMLIILMLFSSVYWKRS